MKSIFKNAVIGTYALAVSGLAAAQLSQDAAPADQGTSAQASQTPDAAPGLPPAATPTADLSPPEKKASSNRAIEEIVVTAQRREESIGNVPIAISAFSGEKLESLGVGNPKALPQITPGLQYDSLVGYSVIYLRGVGTDLFTPNADPSVSTYIDGIYFPFSHGLASDFGKLQRVEVIKGPQGTLFGRNSTGGAISVTTAAPNKDKIEGSVSYKAGSFSEHDFKGYISGPLTDKLSAAISIIDNQDETYYKRPTGSTFAPFPAEQSTGVNAKLEWEPTDTLGGTLAGFITRQQGLSSVVISSFDPKPAGGGLPLQGLPPGVVGLLPTAISQGAITPPSPAPYYTNPNEDIHFRASSNVAYGNFHWTPEPFDMKLLSSWQQISTDTNFDFEGTAAPLVDFHPKNQGAGIGSQEFQILSKEGGLLSKPFGLPFNWTLGAYHFTSSKAGFRDLIVHAADSIILPTSALQAALLTEPGFQNLPTTPVSLLVHGLTDTRSYAGYAQGSLDFYHFTLTFGGRYTSESRKLTTANVYYAGGDDKAIGPPIFNYSPRVQIDKKFTPKVSLDYHLFDNSLLYASYTTGFKSGTFNIIDLYKAPGEVKPETETTYEVGMKGNFLDGRLKYTAAAFQNQIKDLQVLFISFSSGGAITIENAGAARIRGGDLDITFQPFTSFLRGLVVTGGGAYLRGKYTSYPDGSGFDQTTGLFFGGTGGVVGGGVTAGRDFTGNTTVRTPKLSGNLGLSYIVDVIGGNLEAGGGVYYNSGYFFSAQNDQTASQKKYSVVNARLSYLNDWSNIRLSVFGTNLLRDKYFYNKFETDFNTIGTYAPPREWAASLQWTF